MNRRTFFQRLLSSTPPEVHLLPSHAFFVETVAMGPVSIKDAAGVARLALEDMAPLPLEFLSWGMFGMDGNDKALLYATTKERLRSLDAKVSDDTLYELPAFLAALPGKPFEQKTVLSFCDSESFSILAFEANERMPSRVMSFPLPSEEELEVLFNFKNQQEGDWVRQGYSPEAQIYRLNETETSVRGAVHFSLELLSENGSSENLTPAIYEDAARLWLADVRDELFKTQEAKKRHIEAILSYVWKGGLGFATFLLVIELVLSIAAGWNHLRENKIQSQEPAVQMALQNQSLLESLRQLYSSELKPFEMMDLLNQVRPKELYFNQFSSEDYLHADVKGTGSSVDQVNEYAALVQEIPEVEAVLVSDVQTRQGKVQFNLQITFYPPIEVIEDVLSEEPSELAESMAENSDATESITEPAPVVPPESSPLAQPQAPVSELPATTPDSKKPEALAPVATSSNL